MKKYNVAILGATGAVGQEFLNLIEERRFPFANLKLLASKRSAGKKIQSINVASSAVRNVHGQGVHRGGSYRELL